MGTTWTNRGFRISPRKKTLLDFWVHAPMDGFSMLLIESVPVYGRGVEQGGL